MGDTSVPAHKSRNLFGFLLLLGTAIFLATGTGNAWADRLLLLEPREALKQRLSALPDANPEQVARALAIRPTRAELLDGIPESAVRQREDGLEVIGRVIRIIPGLRQGDGSDPTQHDKLVFHAGYGKDAPVVVIPAFYLRGVVSHVDSAEDFEWLFSNRHTLAGVAPGSAVHRQLLTSLVDPSGWLGLVDEPRFIDSPDLREGAYTLYLQQGRPTQESLLDKWRWDRGQQFLLRADDQAHSFADNVDIVDPFVNWYSLLLGSAAMAGQYPGMTAELATWSLDSLSMLCGLRFADPVLADGLDAVLAARARAAGVGCYDTLSWAMGQQLHKDVLYRDPDRPVTAAQMQQAAVTLIARSPGMQEVVLQEPVEMMAPMALPVFDVAPIMGMDFEGREPPAPLPWAGQTAISKESMQPAHDVVVLLRNLVDLAADPGTNEETAALAKTTLQRWLGQGLPDENTRYWRDMVWENNRHSMKENTPARIALSFELLCDAGWTLPVDVQDRIDWLLAVALGEALDRPARTRSMLSLLNIIRQTAPGDLAYGQQLSGYISDEFSEPSCCEADKAMWDIWVQVSARPQSCADLSTIGLETISPD